MRRNILGFLGGLAILAGPALAQETASPGPYKLLKTAKVQGLAVLIISRRTRMVAGCIFRAAPYRAINRCRAA